MVITRYVEPRGVIGRPYYIDDRIGRGAPARNAAHC
jgi:hypothetical protein